MENTPATFLLDTGSQVTLISTNLVTKIGYQDRVEQSNLRLSSFTKNNITTSGAITITLMIAGLTTAHSCIVIPSMDVDILLGADFMMKHDITLHMGTGKVSSRSGETSFRSLNKLTDNSKRRAKVKLVRTTTIPPNTAMFLAGRTGSQDNLHKHGTIPAFVDPYHKTMNKTNTFIGASIFNVTTSPNLTNSPQQRVPVAVINPSPRDITLYKNTVLGLATPIDIDGHLRGAKKTSPDVENHNRDSENGWNKEELMTALKIEGLSISDNEKTQLESIIWNNRECFSTSETDLGMCKFYKAEIKLKHNHQPRWIPARPIAYKLRDAMEDTISGLLDAGVIEECNERSYWNSPVFLVEKPNGRGYRFVADFRAVNGECLPDGGDHPGPILSRSHTPN